MATANGKQICYWNEIAGPKWVKISDEMDARFTQITQALLEASRASPGMTLLDIGCGTGSVSALLAAQVGINGKITGVDISEPMLSVGRATHENIENLHFLNADAQTFDFGPASYDLIVSRFGVMFFDDPIAAFKNLQSALVEGGRLCFVAWASLAQNLHWSLPFEVVSQSLGAPEPKPVHAPGPMALADPDYITSILASAGFGNITIEPISVMIIGKTLLDETRIASLLGPSGALMEEKKANDEIRQILMSKIALVLRQFEGVDGVNLPATINLVTASK
jgi:SAM-dependent methyltransferase